MLNEKQAAQMIFKLQRIQETYDKYLFQKMGELDYKIFETEKQYHTIPEDALFHKMKRGEKWGGEGKYCWFKGVYIPDKHLDGKRLYIYPRLGGYEGMLWVNNIPSGTFATKIVVTRHGNHYCNQLIECAKEGKAIEVAIEFYAGHYVIGCQPFEENKRASFRYQAEEIGICIKDNLVAAFIFDLKVLVQLARNLSENSFRKATIMNTLQEVHKVVYYSPEDVEISQWRQALEEACNIMKIALNKKNGDSAPTAALVGHSHLDTAWLWTAAETLKKIARTVSNQISLMEQYPEYTFIQSSTYHTSLMEQHYPKIFSMMCEKIKEGRYEPNGGVWVECDCNITSGEAMIRQFLWGQYYTKKHFDYLSDCFWLPDTFGYSGAIPQIMKGFGVKYFLTTKLSWNDTNQFPFDTFSWSGIDGSKVLVHFFDMDTWPDPKSLLGRINGVNHENSIINKGVTSKRLIGYGYGDGGGGPQFEMIEVAQRLNNLEGCPKVEHTTVSTFMKALEKEVTNLPEYSGELYLELHRGTLTNQHEIKRNNRKGEMLLRNLEIVEVMNAVSGKRNATDQFYRDLWGILLVNQFHDILPGTCIQAVHEQCKEEMNSMLKKAQRLIYREMMTKDAKCVYTLFNPLSFSRTDYVYFDVQDMIPKDKRLKTQIVQDVYGQQKLAVSGINQEALSFKSIEFLHGKRRELSEFVYENNRLTTPFAYVTFDEQGYIMSFIDRRNGRQLCGEGLPFNTFISAEDVSKGWDGWDIDADCMIKFQPETQCISRAIVGDGALEFRIRSIYKICSNSRLEQDMIFYTSTPQVDFETRIDWNDKHRFLKTRFDTSIRSQYATHEIQFGNIKRPTTRNNGFEQAMFEVVNHKYTDLSETQYGIAFFNDCKYGVSVEGGSVGLSLHKGGCRPDENGDRGLHIFKYAMLPHMSGFSAKDVVCPAYLFNVPRIIKTGRRESGSFIQSTAENIIIEAMKPCEKAEKSFIVRLYECEGTYTETDLILNMEYTSTHWCNMMEEVIENMEDSQGICFKPFEIKTLKIKY